MAGSDNNDATLDDLLSLFSPTEDAEARKRVLKAMYSEDHPFSYFLRQATSDEPFVEDWPPKDLPVGVASSLGEKDLAERIRDEVRTALAPFLDGGSNVTEVSSREIADTLLVACGIDESQQLNFLLLVGAEIENAQKEYAGRILEGQTEKSDTVSSNLDTTFAASKSNPQATILRHDALLTFKQIDLDQSNIFLLHEYAGRTTEEIADLLGSNAASISQQLSIASVEIRALMDA